MRITDRYSRIGQPKFDACDSRKFTAGKLLDQKTNATWSNKDTNLDTYLVHHRLDGVIELRRGRGHSSVRVDTHGARLMKNDRQQCKGVLN